MSLVMRMTNEIHLEGPFTRVRCAPIDQSSPPIIVPCNLHHLFICCFISFIGDNSNALNFCMSHNVLTGGAADVTRIIDNLKHDFQGSDYHIMKKNCNCFANAFTKMLIGKPIPAYTNRMAEIGTFFSCIIDPMIAAAQNQNQTQSQTQSTAIQNRSQPTSSSRDMKMNTTKSPFSGPGRKLGKD